jgi:hypothetical protein
VLALATVAALAVAAGIGYSAIGGGVVHACYGNNGMLKAYDPSAGEMCRESSVDLLTPSGTIANATQAATAADASKLGGLAPSAYRVTGSGVGQAVVTVNGCGSDESVAYTVTVTQPTLIFATGGVSNSVDLGSGHRPSGQLILRDASNAVVARSSSNRGSDSVAVAGVLANAERTPVAVQPGMYTLAFRLTNFGPCGSGFVQYQDILLSHLAIPAS